VKPGNVLLAPDGTWKVADFGIAKSTESIDTLTGTGIVMCTPGYVAPERVNGDPATPASDLYSVGVLLYEALSGRRPFMADNPLAVAHLAQTEDPPPLDSLRTGLDPKLIAIVHRALEREPKKRFKSALDMRDALVELTELRPETISDDPTTAIETKHVPATSTQSVPTGFAPAPVPAPTKVRMPSLTLLTTIVLGFMAIIILIALAKSDDGGGNAPGIARQDNTTATSTATLPISPAAGIDKANLPAPLKNALERLENEVQP
jgi:serine/threonine-protein kinase